MKKVISFVLVGLLLLGGISLPTEAFAEEREQCEITIDANKHTPENPAEATGVCKGHVTGYYIESLIRGQFVLLGPVTGIVNESGQKFHLIPLADVQPDLTVYLVEKEDDGSEIENPEDTQIFHDVDSKHWAKKEIERAVELGIVNGYPDGNFGPDDFVQRQHVAAMLARAFKLKPSGTELPFNIDKKHPHYNEIAAVYEAGLMNGYGDGTFGSRDYINHPQMAVLLQNILKLEPKGEFPFHNIDEKHWAYDAIYAMGSNRIFIGDGTGYFLTKMQITRAELAAYLVRILDTFEIEEF